MVTVSIGVPAYNEEKYIQGVLRGILKQQRVGWELKEIIVLCDGVTDRTADKARSVKSDLLQVLDFPDRRGKTARLNQLFKQFTGDILIMFDGDIEFSSNQVINLLLQPFSESAKVMLVGGNSSPVEPINFVQRAVNSTFSVFYESRKITHAGHNIFGATGSILAIRKKLAKKITLPAIISEDAYLYLACVEAGYHFRYVDQAVIYYRLPTTFRDYIRQLLRSSPHSVENELEPYFGKQVHSAFYRPFFFYARTVIKTFLKNPLGVLTIVGINILARPFHRLVIKNYKLDWFTAHSTH